MATTENQIVIRQGREGKRRSVPLAIGVNILQGTYVYLNATGHATDVKVDATTVFAGVAVQQADNTDGGLNDLDVEVYTDGDFEVPITLTNQADVGARVYGADNYDATLTLTANSSLGHLTQFISTTKGVVSIHGLGEATI